jgi:hypothetical protein
MEIGLQRNGTSKGNWIAWEFMCKRGCTATGSKAFVDEQVIGFENRPFASEFCYIVPSTTGNIFEKSSDICYVETGYLNCNRTIVLLSDVGTASG